MTKNVDELDISRFSSVEEYNRYFMEVYQLGVYEPEEDYFRQEDWE